MDILYWTSVGALFGATATAIVGGMVVKQRIDRKIRRIEGRMDAAQMLAYDRSRADFRRITDLEQRTIQLQHALNITQRELLKARE
jgi:hypothetical protein